MPQQVRDFAFSVDLMRAILWQYEDAAHLQGIVRQKQAFYDANQSQFWLDWYNNVFNLQTANDFGLAVWGIILDESRDAYVGAAVPGYPAFGFKYRRNFNRGNFKRGNAGYLRINTPQYRLLLRLKYYKLISRGLPREINFLLKKLFEAQGDVYVLDGLDMSSSFVFKFEPQAWQRFVFADMDALPRPAGVGVKIRYLTRCAFGFGTYHKNFTCTFKPKRK